MPSGVSLTLVGPPVALHKLSTESMSWGVAFAEHKYPGPACGDRLALDASVVLLDRDPARVAPADHSEQVPEPVRGDHLDGVVRQQSNRDGGRGLRPSRHSIGGGYEGLDLDTEDLRIPQMHRGLVLYVPRDVGCLGAQCVEDAPLSVIAQRSGVEERKIKCPWGSTLGGGRAGDPIRGRGSRLPRSASQAGR